MYNLMIVCQKFLNLSPPPPKMLYHSWNQPSLGRRSGEPSIRCHYGNSVTSLLERVCRTQSWEQSCWVLTRQGASERGDGRREEELQGGGEF